MIKYLLKNININVYVMFLKSLRLIRNKRRK